MPPIEYVPPVPGEAILFGPSRVSDTNTVAAVFDVGNNQLRLLKILPISRLTEYATALYRGMWSGILFHSVIQA